MRDKVFRCQYQGQLAEFSNMDKALYMCKLQIKELLESGQLLTVALFRHGSMLFAYYECVGRMLMPDKLFLGLEPYLLQWPGEESLRGWVPMNLIFYHCIPDDVERWKRRIKPQKRKGRLAILQSDKLFSYVYHHVELTTEGLLIGDKYLSIALHENLLFAYTEEPRVLTCVTGKTDGVSKAIQGWRDAVPMSHFIKWPDSQDHFTDMETLLLLYE